MEERPKRMTLMKCWPVPWRPGGDQDDTSTPVEDLNGSKSPREPVNEVSITINEADVLKEVHLYKNFQVPSVAAGIEVTDLQTFYDLTAYGVSEDQQEQLWAVEVSRLVKAVTVATPLPFNGSGELAVDSKKSYEIMAALADQFYQVLNIVSLDCESFLAENENLLCEESYLERSRVNLGYLCDRDENEAEETAEKTPSTNQEDLFEFINYCTAVFARLICTATEGEVFYAAILAHLAKISTKIKVLSSNPKEYAEISLENGVSSQEVQVPQASGLRGRQGDANMVDSNLTPEGGLRDNANANLIAMADLMRSMKGQMTRQKLGQLETTSRKEAIKKLYFFREAAIQHNLVDFLFFLLVSLRGNSRMMRTTFTSYEICSLIYETGLERFRTLVFQDQDGDFLGTSKTSNLNYARSVIHMLSQSVQQISTEDGSPGNAGAAQYSNIDPGADEDKPVETQISWSYVPGDHESGSLQVPNIVRLKSMSRVITIIIPMIISSPAFADRMGDFMSMVTATDLMREREKEGKVKPRVFGNYSAFFSLTTSEYATKQKDRGPSEAKSLSNALMRRNNLLSGKEITQIGRVPSLATAKVLPDPTPAEDRDSKSMMDLERIQRHQTELDNVREKMRKCVLEEKGVMVQCKLFVTRLMLVCAALVAGGIAVGITVGERIPGVDPFNITTYCWVMAGFLLLVAKSIRVRNWPWNDFLRGRVLCTAVSELSSVTGIDEQLIIAYLLQDESSSYLQTRGPFNAVFKRRSDDGFSIDLPITMWTMLMCGLIMIEVESVDGRGLVCLDLRGRRNGFIKSLGTIIPDKDGDQHVYCQSLPETKLQGAQKGSYRVKLNVGGGMAWRRAIGFYGNRDAEFV
ncbi:unnamed protein product [Clonostachys solani]|uniref:Uncharacterized protein n=1 Tax=Clonostachys solani TaxID=160281 RepID=A0A9N9YQQ6_9HYPO|nr:unnamed protein product [Clonostachys solani]